MSKPEQHRRAVIGNASNFWLHSSKTNRFDLTHPKTPTSPPCSRRLDLQTTTTPITVDPDKTALVIIDMQNFFLSEAFGRKRGNGHAALEKLEKYAIPGARKAGVRIIWLNWGLTDEDVDTMPPAVKRAFGFEAVVDEDGEITAKHTESGEVFKEKADGVGVDKDGSPKHQGGHVLLENGKDARIYKGLGSQCGEVFLPGGETVDAGRLLMRDSWNAALYPPLDKIYEEGARMEKKPDVWLHKNRMSGMWGTSTPCQEFLEKEGIKTLLFTGVNTDQCVSGTFTDSFSKGYDCVMLADGCGTTSPEFSQQCIEFNAAKTWGLS
ncbi:Phosphatidylinositol 4-kinase pik1alpha (PI4-kinase)(PtdIns-4-kinase) [Taxawa tesnikishii (nom. ined.)]|nr:Phosphatidylinositol 4-kinase pik1alpha (PI4-kinase)(PtdIns-4-kinase) [Dothideales sp. JES 119]